MKKIIKLGIIGFGEVGYAIASGLKEEGLENIAIYDALLRDNPSNNLLLYERIQKAKVKKYTDIEKLVYDVDVIFSTNSANAAIDVAKKAALFLEKQHLYVDLNSTSLKTQKKIEETLKSIGCKFVDAAIMGGIALYGYKTPIIASGSGRELFANLFKPYGMNINPNLVEEAGQASALKMYRSIITKGVEALLIEMLVAAYRDNVSEQVFDLVCAWIDDQKGFSTLAKSMVSTHAIHAGRRAFELKDVCETVKQVHMDPLMTEASLELFKRTDRSGVREFFNSKVPHDFMQVIRYLSEKIK